MKRYFPVFFALALLEILFYFSPFRLSELIGIAPAENGSEGYTVTFHHNNIEFDTLDMKFDGHIYIKTSIGDDTTKYWFMLDTGAGVSSIDEELGEKFCSRKFEKSKPLTDVNHQTKHVDQYFIPKVKIGKFSFEGVPFVKEMRERPKCEEKKDHGIIGADIMWVMNWLIDYKEEKIYLIRKDDFTMEGDDIYTLPISLGSSNRPKFNLKINDTEVSQINFDTGSNGGLGLPMSIYQEKFPLFLNEYQFQVRGETSSGFYGYVENELVRTVINKMELGGLCLDMAPVDFENHSAKILGNEILKYFRVFIDYSKKEVKLQSNGEIRDRISEIKPEYGLRLKYSEEGKILVSSVLVNSYADKVGISYKDEVLSINGQEFCGDECAFYQWNDSLLKSGEDPVMIEFKNKGIHPLQYEKPIQYEL